MDDAVKTGERTRDDAAQALAERVAESMFANDRASRALDMRVVRVAPGCACARHRAPTRPSSTCSRTAPS